MFLDRDGTINVKAPEGRYIERAEDLVLLEGAPMAIRRINASGALAIVVTNQRGIARGRMTEADLLEVHARLTADLARHGARIDAFYHCPHEAGTCDCRKPRTGMFVAARHDRPGIDFSRAAMVGDAATDVEAAASVGMLTALIDRDGAQVERAARWRVKADLRVASLAEAVDQLEPRLARFSLSGREAAAPAQSPRARPLRARGSGPG